LLSYFQFPLAIAPSLFMNGNHFWVIKMLSSWQKKMLARKTFLLYSIFCWSHQQHCRCDFKPFTTLKLEGLSCELCHWWDQSGMVSGPGGSAGLIQWEKEMGMGIPLIGVGILERIIPVWQMRRVGWCRPEFQIPDQYLPFMKGFLTLCECFGDAIWSEKVEALRKSFLGLWGRGLRSHFNKMIFY
jgi:hypothetical protein